MSEEGSTPLATRAASWARATARDPITWIAVGAAVAMAVVAVRSRGVMVDDAGITARYAERIADGRGWTYNDGDRTNGASAPLYTLLLAAAHAVGIDVLDAALAIGVLGAATCVALVAHVAGRISGRVGAVSAAVLLIAWPFWQAQASSGMESMLAASLGIGVIVALLHDRDTVAGVVLGLALLTKLDAAMLAGAVAVGVVAVRGRPPWRIAAVSAAVLAPWLLFSLLSFGSPLPHSLTSKAAGDLDNPAFVHDPRWVLDHLWLGGTGLLVPVGLAALVLVPSLRRDRPPAAVAVVVAVAWPVLHGLALSIVDLGDAYSWYLTVLSPPIALAAGVTLGALARSTPSPRWLGPAVALAIVVQSVGLLAPGSASALRTTSGRVREGREPTAYEGFDRARMDAGRYLGEVAEPGDVVETCYGWIARGVPQATIRESCPLNTRDPVGPPTWIVLARFPGTDPTVPPPASELVESFVSDTGEGARVDVYRADPGG